jgi:hypothetical protein
MRQLLVTSHNANTSIRRAVSRDAMGEFIPRPFASSKRAAFHRVKPRLICRDN